MVFKHLLWISHRFGTSLRKRGFIAFTKSVATGSIAIGCIALLLSLAVLDGFQESLEKNAIKFTAHIRVQSFIGEKPAELPDIVLQYPGIQSIEKSIQREGLIRKNSQGEIEGVLLKGIDDQQEFSLRPKHLEVGSFNFTTDSSKEIIISKTLADKLNVSIDSSVIFTVMTFNPSQPNIPIPINAKCIIKGIYSTGMSQYDDIYIFIPKTTLNTIIGLDKHEFTHYEIMAKENYPIKELSEWIQEQVPYPLFVQNVYDLHGGMFNWIELQKKPIPIVLSLISIVAVLNILTSLLISVLEKTKSIGILRSIGMNQQSIVLMFIWQGLIVGLSGIFLGCAISFGLCSLQQHYGLITLKADLYFVDTLPIKISAWHYYLVCSISLILSLISTFIPAYIASRIEPTKALRFS